MFRANRLFGPAGLPGGADAEARSRARGRLFEALQAVHLRGETHVTVRELRAALVYILFGSTSATTITRAPPRRAHRPVPAYWDPAFGPFPATDAASGTAPPLLPYWDRAFDPQSPRRQGGVLGDLARFDPGPRRASADRSTPGAPGGGRRPPGRGGVSGVEPCLGAAARVFRMVRTGHRVDHRGPARARTRPRPSPPPVPPVAGRRRGARSGVPGALRGHRPLGDAAAAGVRPSPASFPLRITTPAPRRRRRSGSRSPRIASISKPTCRPHPPVSTGCTGRRRSSTAMGTGARSVSGSARSCSTCCWN